MTDEVEIPTYVKCDMTILRWDDNRLRHCTMPAEHVLPSWPYPQQKDHSDGQWWWAV